MKQRTLFDEQPRYTVSEINADVRALIEDGYNDVAVVGEISNLKRHSSGHAYFTLKDADAQLSAACFRRDAEQIDFDLEDGMEVVAAGRLTVYERYGRYQLVVRTIEKTGAGALEKAFQQLKETLAAEGLFDASHKRALPAFPLRIGVVTSPTGAVIRDIISTIRRRWPCADVLLWPVRVQGEGAAQEIAHAIQSLGATTDVEVIIAGRGGGSLEDLWAFNEEVVARALYASAVPVISAVGHESDVTIADFVADHRAATPTMAAEIAVPERREVSARLDGARDRLVRQMRTRLDMENRRLQEQLRSYALGRIRGLIEQHMQTLDYAMDKLGRCATAAIDSRQARLDRAMTRLRGLDARAVLDRGYTICADPESGRIIRSADTVHPGGELRVTFHDGSVDSIVKEKVDERRKQEV